jgi:hypothetical protein
MGILTSQVELYLAQSEIGISQTEFPVRQIENMLGGPA